MVKLGKKENSERKTIEVGTRTWNIKPISRTSDVNLRGRKAELIVEIEIVDRLGLKCDRAPIGSSTDLFALRKDRIRKPLQVKGKSVETPDFRGIHITEKAYDEFEGVYIVLVEDSVEEYEPGKYNVEYRYLLLTSQEMRHEMEDEKRGHLWRHDKEHRQKRWYMRVTDDNGKVLDVFKKYEGCWWKVEA